MCILGGVRQCNELATTCAVWKYLFRLLAAQLLLPLLEVLLAVVQPLHNENEAIHTDKDALGSAAPHQACDCVVLDEEQALQHNSLRWYCNCK